MKIMQYKLAIIIQYTTSCFLLLVQKQASFVIHLLEAPVHEFVHGWGLTGPPRSEPMGGRGYGPLAGQLYPWSEWGATGGGATF